MSVETILVFNNLFAILTLVATAGAIGLLVYRVVKVRKRRPCSGTRRSGSRSLWPSWPPLGRCCTPRPSTTSPAASAGSSA